MLAEDPATELVIVVSKPPAKEVADEITAYAEALATPVQLAFLGAGQPDLTAAARRAVETIGGDVAPAADLDSHAAPAGGGVAARSLRRRHALRRGDGHRSPGAGADPVQHPSAARLGTARRPAGRRPHR